MQSKASVICEERGPLGKFWGLLKLAAAASYRDNCFGIAKGAAYSGLLSFFPVLTTVATLLVQANARQVSRTIARFLYEVVPPGTEEVVRQLFTVQGQRPAYVLIGAVIVAAWAASGAVLSMMEGFRAIYQIPSGRGFIRDRGMALLLVFVSVLPIWAASALIVIGTRTVAQLLGLLPAERELSAWVAALMQGLRFVVAFCSFVLVTAMIYYLAPNRKHTFRSVLPGAVLATLLWLLATVAFGWWVRHVANYNVLYGSVGAGLALLAWMYVLAVVTFYGAEFNAVQERSRSIAYPMLAD
jgi:membrane protein